MRTKNFRSLLAVMASTVLLMAAFTGSMAWGQSRSEAVVASQTFSTLQAQQTANYWTPERMASATPMPMPIPKAVSMRSQTTFAPPQGPVVIASSGLPSDERWQETIPQLAPLQEPLWGAYPWSFTRYQLFPPRNDLLMYRTFPYRMVGKLFFTIPGQGRFVCSASVLNSDNNSVVWTAGHCVYSPGVGFHTDFLFSPGRWIGNNPFGTWTAKTAFTLGGWTSGLLEYDHGALVMNLGGLPPARKIGDVVGWLGFSANVSRQQHWHLHGYPSAARDLSTTPPGAQFNGENHEICAAPWATNDQPTGQPGVDPPTIGVGCDQTPGCSGGPWLIDFSGVGGATNMLNGNNSYLYLGGPPWNLRLFGPYFSNGAINLRDVARVVPVP